MNSQAAASRPTPPIGALPLAGVEKILVKFSFTNRAHVPPGIAEKTRASDQKMDVKHQFDAIKEDNVGVIKVGLHRPGRVDTGEPVIKDLQGVQAAMLRRGLSCRGFQLVDIHWFLWTKPGRTPKFTVVCVYERGPTKELSPATTASLRSLATSARWACHVWQNPSGVATINFVARQPDARIQNALVVCGDAIVARPVTEDVKEEDE